MTELATEVSAAPPGDGVALRPRASGVVWPLLISLALTGWCSFIGAGAFALVQVGFVAGWAFAVLGLRAQLSRTASELRLERWFWGFQLQTAVFRLPVRVVAWRDSRGGAMVTVDGRVAAFGVPTDVAIAAVRLGRLAGDDEDL